MNNQLGYVSDDGLFSKSPSNIEGGPQRTWIPVSQSPTTMKIKFKKLHHAAITPTYGTPGAACFDLYAATVDSFSSLGSNVSEGNPVTCDTGLVFEVPEGHVMLIFSRSGHGFKNDIRLANCTGVIDSDYRGNVQVKLTCDRPEDDMLSVPFHVKPGDRIAQAMIIPVPTVEFELADELSSTARGAGGLGSTGS